VYQSLGIMRRVVLNRIVTSILEIGLACTIMHVILIFSLINLTKQSLLEFNRPQGNGNQSGTNGRVH
jgi:hypothetical protein